MRYELRINISMATSQDDCTPGGMGVSIIHTVRTVECSSLSVAASLIEECGALLERVLKHFGFSESPRGGYSQK